MGRIVNPFEQLAKRLGGAPWIGSISGYSPSAEALDGVARWMRILSELARQVDGNEVPHLLASPARLLGYRPGDHAAKEIDEQIARVSDAYAAILVRNAMEWADMSAQGKRSPEFPLDLFEPLLALLERGCQFKLRKGYLEVGDNAFPLHGWPNLASG